MKKYSFISNKNKGLQSKKAFFNEGNNAGFFKPMIFRKEGPGKKLNEPSSIEDYVNSLNGLGGKLDESTKKFFEPKFGYDFSDVKIHSDNDAARSAQSINASAYTAGNNIVFNKSQFSPETESGKKLLAHELAHVIQQNRGTISNKNNLQRQENDPEKNLQITKRVELDAPTEKLPSIIQSPENKKTEDDKPHLGIDFSKSISANPPKYPVPDTYSFSLVYRNLDVISGSDDASVSFDFLHEPNFQLTLSPDPNNAQIYQAAWTIVNMHLRRNKQEFLEIGLGAQGSLSRPLNLWNAGASLQVELHITSSFSLTATSALSASPHSDNSPMDYSSVSLGTAHGMDWNWSPISIGMLWHLKK